MNNPPELDEIEARRTIPTDELLDTIALAIRNYVVAENPGLINFAENLPWFWNDQAAKIAALLRERFEINPK